MRVGGLIILLLLKFPGEWRQQVARSFTLALIICVVSRVAVSPAIGQAGGYEYDVKAAFLFNLTKFVEWPETTFASVHTPIILGIVGDDPFGGTLSRIVEGQVVSGRPVTIRKYRFGDDLSRCQVLFISPSDRLRVPQILASLQGASVLTVSDTEQFVDAGGMMQLIMEQSRVRFIVSLNAVAKTKLQISARLLALARGANRSELRGVK
jgi:hypothetical protein